MSTIGLRDLFAAMVTEDAEGKEAYGAPVRLAKAIKADLSVESAEAILHADDDADEVVKEFGKGKLKINVNDLEPKKEAFLLGQSMDDDGVVYAGDDDEPPYLAIGFRAKKPRGRFRYVWLYKVKFKIPSESYETRGDNISFKTPELEGEFVRRRKDGRWKADHTCLPEDTIAKDWFIKVREPGDKKLAVPTLDGDSGTAGTGAPVSGDDTEGEA